MAELTFYYGVMGSAKTTQLLTNNFAHKEKGRRTLVLSPILDSRRERGIVKSRIGISAEAVDFTENDNLTSLVSKTEPDVVFVDEVQFCTAQQIDQLHKIAINLCMPVFAYGLKTDFTTHFFEGSKRLLEIADNIIEIPANCKCGRKAKINARIINNKIVNDGPQVLIGDTHGEIRYEGMCALCAGIV